MPIGREYRSSFLVLRHLCQQLSWKLRFIRSGLDSDGLADANFGKHSQKASYCEHASLIGGLLELQVSNARKFAVQEAFGP
jgi:hypothetical protein